MDRYLASIGKLNSADVLGDPHDGYTVLDCNDLDGRYSQPTADRHWGWICLKSLAFRFAYRHYKMWIRSLQISKWLAGSAGWPQQHLGASSLPQIAHAGMSRDICHGENQ
jgi:hypothetical protein